MRLRTARDGTVWVVGDEGRYYGYLDGPVFVKRVAQSHMLREPPAWAVQADALAFLRGHGVLAVELRDLATGAPFARAALVDFERHGFPVDRGHGPQTALPLRWWTYYDDAAKRRRQPITTTKTATQGRLFDSTQGER